MHDLLIIVHLLAGLLAFGVGLYVSLEPAGHEPRFRLYLGSLVVTVLALIVVVLRDWGGLSTALRITYAGLSLLAVYLLVRGYQARAVLKVKRRGWAVQYVDHIGFTLISLLDAFVIVAAIDLGVPVWLVVIVGVLAVAGGVAGLNRLKLRVS